MIMEPTLIMYVMSLVYTRGTTMAKSPWCVFLGAADFMGMNYYTSHYTTTKIHAPDPPSYSTDSDVRTWQDPSWPK